MSAVTGWRPRRERADTVVAREYERLKPDVLRTLRQKLAARGVHFDDSDLEAFYNQAWHGVHTRLAAGEAIGNRGGLVVTIAERRALDEVRSLHADRRAAVDELDVQQVEPDLAARLDDRVRFGQFVEGLRDRLTPREQEAAALCYVHDYTRREAALTLGVSSRRMEKVMDSVSKKLGGLLTDIERGEWCERRESLIKAYALGLLDINGARYVLAVAHLEDCPACRHRVLRMRGLASLTPPAPAALVTVAAGAGGGAGDRTRLGRRARNAGLTAAAAGALAATALAGARLADERTDRASEASAAAGETRAAGDGAGAGGGARTAGQGPGGARTGRDGASGATADGGPARDPSPPARSATSPDAPTPRATGTPTATPKLSRAKPQRRKVSRSRPVPAPVATAAPRAVATPPPAAPAPARPPRDRDGAGEFELR